MALKIPKLGSKCEKIALLVVLRGIRRIGPLNHAAPDLDKGGEGPGGGPGARGTHGLLPNL